MSPGGGESIRGWPVPWKPFCLNSLAWGPGPGRHCRAEAQWSLVLPVLSRAWRRSTAQEQNNCHEWCPGRWTSEGPCTPRCGVRRSRPFSMLLRVVPMWHRKPEDRKQLDGQCETGVVGQYGDWQLIFKLSGASIEVLVISVLCQHSRPRNLDVILAGSHNGTEIKFWHLGACDLDVEINFGYRLIQMMHLYIWFCG